jgi:hypothetical protein
LDQSKAGQVLTALLTSELQQGLVTEVGHLSRDYQGWGGESSNQWPGPKSP